MKNTTKHNGMKKDAVQKKDSKASKMKEKARKPMGEKTATATESNVKNVTSQDTENNAKMVDLQSAENTAERATLQPAEKDSITPNTVTLLTERHGNLTLTRYQTTLNDGTLLQWARMTEPNQPDFRMFKIDDTWYFPATECRGYFGLYESPIPAKNHVRKENRVLLPAIDRGGWVQKLWLVDLEGLLILAKDAKADRRAVFVKRLATVILPLIGGDLRVKDGYYHQLKKENGEIIDRNHRLRAQNTQYQDTIAHQIKTIDRLKDQLKRDDKLFGKQKETIVNQKNSLQEKEAQIAKQSERIDQLVTIKKTMNARYAGLSERYGALESMYRELQRNYQEMLRYTPLIESLQASLRMFESGKAADGVTPAVSVPTIAAIEQEQYNTETAEHILNDAAIYQMADMTEVCPF